MRRSLVTVALSALALLVTDYAAWAAECYRIRDKHGQLRPLVLNDVQRAMGEIERAELARHGQARLLALKARQGGVSTDQQARNLHQVWAEPGFDALTLAHTTGDTTKLFEITRRAIDHFPPALLPQLGERATNEVSFPGLDTHFFTGTAGSKRAGRGLTIKRFHGSEFAFWDAPVSTLGTVTPGLVPHGSVVVLETTASGYGSEAHVFWQEAAQRGYRPVFFPWWDCDRANYRLPLLADDELGALTDEEPELVRAHGLDHEQLKWRRAKMAELGRATFLTEYAEDPESCWAAPGGMFYDAELLKALMLRAPTPLRTDLGGTLEVYLEPDQIGAERVIGGADTAEGGGGDRSTFTFRTFPSWRLVAKYADRLVTPKDFAGILDVWGRRYGAAFLVVEKNAHGITVLRHLRDDHRYPVQRLYHRVSHDTEQAQHNAASERIGWATTAGSKPILLDAGRELLNAARDGDAGVPSADALRDAFAVRRDEKGKVELNSRDVLVSEQLAWIGRTVPLPTLLVA